MAFSSATILKNLPRRLTIYAEYAKMLGQSFDSQFDSDYDVAFQPEPDMANKVVRDAERFSEARVEQYFEEVDSG